MSIFVGIDFGESRVGVAVSDDRKQIAFPLGVIKREKGSFGFNAMKKLLEGRDIESFVVGLPVRTDGTVGVEAERVHVYIESLSGVFHKEVVTWDERYTTVIAANVLKEGGGTKDRKKAVDKLSAQLILQSYIDHLKNT